MTNKQMMQQQKTCAKYLAQYAEPEVQSLATFGAEFHYQHVVVIPAFQESTQFIDRFIDSRLAEQACLLIAVLNQPDNDFGRQYQLQQETLAKYIHQQGEVLWQHDNLSLIDLNSLNSNASSCSNDKPKPNSAILLVNRYTQPIPAEQGVGLARKIGADLAVKLFSVGSLTSSWVHSTDADAHLPDNYLVAHSPNNAKLTDAAATCCNFYHHSDEHNIHHANTAHSRQKACNHHRETFRAAPIGLGQAQIDPRYIQGDQGE